MNVTNLKGSYKRLPRGMCASLDRRESESAAGCCSTQLKLGHHSLASVRLQTGPSVSDLITSFALHHSPAVGLGPDTANAEGAISGLEGTDDAGEVALDSGPVAEGEGVALAAGAVALAAGAVALAAGAVAFVEGVDGVRRTGVRRGLVVGVAAGVV